MQQRQQKEWMIFKKVLSKAVNDVLVRESEDDESNGDNNHPVDNTQTE